ncbi:hypothetical protein [Granulicella paludicola]|uniref:hypothetical protein n=1 Tax=Granulicella paludicola TaxID=474951 RepID=UPI0021E0324B|nr:hypothetical protein [Granulicella paludicola]
MLLAAGNGTAFAAEKNGPAMKLSLESLGIPGISTSFLDAGTSMLTIHLLDDSHLLVTFSKRGLLPRLEGDPKDDDDRVVVAEVLELPTGKVMAQTEWRMHDHSRYLWSLGQGRFLLRIGSGFSTFAPLAKLGEKEPFARTSFPWRHGLASAVFVSEDGGMLTLMAQVAAPNARPQIDVGDTVEVHQDLTTVMEFYRLKGTGAEGSPVEVTSAGSLRSPVPFYLPLDSRGYLWPTEVGNNMWSVMFDDMQGKTAPMGQLQSSCTPRLEMVSHSEYLALTCRGADDRVRMASYGLDAQETWQEDFGDFGPPVFQAAPAAGRFAMSRKVEAPVVLPTALGGPPMMNNDAASTADRQEVRVYQTASGSLLLKTDASPAIKTAENFSLSEDGTELAVVREGAIEVFKLPGLTARDKDDVAEVAKFAPPEDTGPVLLGLLTGRPKARETVKAAAMAEPQPAALADVSAAVDAPGNAKVAGPAVPKRKPPTLLKPGEKAQFGGSKGAEAAPQ